MNLIIELAFIFAYLAGMAFALPLVCLLQAEQIVKEIEQ